MGGFQNTATRERPGTVSLSNSSRFAPSCAAISVIPVMLPPGRARLAMRPGLDRISGETAHHDRDGTVACLAAKLAGEPEATMRSTLAATSSAASSGSRSLRPFGEAVLDDNVPALDVTVLAQPL